MFLLLLVLFGVQIQLPGGQTYSNTFQASDSLELVVSAVCTQHTSLDPADVSILEVGDTGIYADVSSSDLVCILPCLMDICL